MESAAVTYSIVQVWNAYRDSIKYHDNVSYHEVSVSLQLYTIIGKPNLDS